MKYLHCKRYYSFFQAGALHIIITKNVNCSTPIPPPHSRSPDNVIKQFY